MILQGFAIDLSERRELDHVDAAFAPLALRDERLGLPEPGRHFGLCEAGGAARHHMAVSKTTIGRVGRLGHPQSIPKRDRKPKLGYNETHE